MNLANRLLFELVSEESVEEKRQKAQEKIEKIIKRRAQYFYSCGMLNFDKIGYSQRIRRKLAHFRL